MKAAAGGKIFLFWAVAFVAEAILKTNWQTDPLYVSTLDKKLEADTHEELTGTTQTGCTSKFLLPDLPFVVIWNHPSGGCEAHGVDLNLSAWGILENDGDAFAGEIIRIYYDLGIWPTLFNNGSVRTNGGVPQCGDLHSHLSQVKSQVLQDIKKDFDGVAVIDMESWRPRFEHNFDSLWQYQNVSINIVKARYPYLNKTETLIEAAREFNNGAQVFMGGTLNTTTDLRPGGYWGYYGFPRNWGGASGQAANDKLEYLWLKSSALFPRIYMSNAQPYERGKAYVHGEINETLRVFAKFSSPDTLILPYTLCNNNGTNYFSTENLTLAIGLPGEMGAAGVVIWGSSGDFQTKNECYILQDYVRTTLGPYVKNLTQFLSACSRSWCSGRGRCVEKSLEAHVQLHRRESGRRNCFIPDEKLTGKRSAKRNHHSDQMSEGTSANKNIRSDRFDENWTKQQSSSRHGSRAVHFEQKENDLTFNPFEDTFNPFDDYICRCLSGWSGDHCQKPA